MKKIAKWNGTYEEVDWKEFELEIPLSHHHHKTFKKYSVVWDNPFARKNLIILMINWFSTIFVLYSLGFIQKYLSGNIFNNTIFSALADVTGITLLGFIYSEVGPKNSLNIMWSLMIASCPILYVSIGTSNLPYVLFLNRVSISAIYTSILLSTV